MPNSFNDWQQFVDSRAHKNKDYRTYKRDLRVRVKDGLASFHFMNRNSEETPMATLTQDGVLTLEYDFSGSRRSMDVLTPCNRLNLLTGIGVGPNKSQHRTKESFIRLYTSSWESVDGSYERRARYSWTDKLDLPYSKGMQFQMADGRIVKLLKAEPDRRRQVIPDMAQKTKADTAVLRKLLIAMTRMGAFDAQLNEKLEKSWYGTAYSTKLDEVNYKDPTGRDAEIVLMHGLAHSQRPDQHKWNPDTKRYDPIGHDELLRSLRSRVVENGMKQLRMHIYNTEDMYEVVEV